MILTVIKKQHLYMRTVYMALWEGYSWIGHHITLYDIPSYSPVTVV